jgi:hypothetical protein
MTVVFVEAIFSILLHELQAAVAASRLQTAVPLHVSLRN